MNTNVTNLYPSPTPGHTDQRLAVAGSVTAFASTWTTGTQSVVLDVQGADVMCTFDGSNPSSSNGHFMANGTSYTWSKQTATAAKFIQYGVTAAAIHLSEFTT